MGKTRPTYRDAVAQQREDWQQMRNWIRNRHQPIYDEMWAHAEEHADAAGVANPTDPMLGILLSICLGQQREIAELCNRLERDE